MKFKLKLFKSKEAVGDRSTTSGNLQAKNKDGSPEIPLEYQDALIGTKGLKKYFPIRQGFLSSIVQGQTQYVKAVDDISFYVRKGEVFGLAGESGSGKSTTGRLLLRLTDITAGQVFFKGKDISNRAEVLNSMLELVQKRQVSFIYITHDLALARHVCDRLAILYLGKIVEMGPTEQVINNPLHPYTQALMAAIPIPDPNYRRGDLPISGEIPSPLNPPQAWRCHTRCHYEFGECTTLEPPLVEVEPGHFVACHMVHK